MGFTCALILLLPARSVILRPCLQSSKKNVPHHLRNAHRDHHTHEAQYVSTCEAEGASGVDAGAYSFSPVPVITMRGTSLKHDSHRPSVVMAGRPLDVHTSSAEGAGGEASARATSCGHI